VALPALAQDPTESHCAPIVSIQRRECSFISLEIGVQPVSVWNGRAPNCADTRQGVAWTDICLQHN
jgi:hypothetical protein